MTQSTLNFDIKINHEGKTVVKVYHGDYITSVFIDDYDGFDCYSTYFGGNSHKNGTLNDCIDFLQGCGLHSHDIITLLSYLK